MGDASLLSFIQHPPADAERNTPAAVAIGSGSIHSHVDDNKQHRPQRASIAHSSSDTQSSRRSSSPSADGIRRLLAVMVCVLFVATSSNTGAFVYGSEIIDNNDCAATDAASQLPSLHHSKHHHHDILPRHDWVHVIPYLSVLDRDVEGIVLVEDAAAVGFNKRSNADDIAKFRRARFPIYNSIRDDIELVRPYPHEAKLNSIYKALKL